MLVRVHAAAINPYDWHMLRGDPYVARLMGGVGLTRPKHRIAGADGAGVVEQVGANVRDLRPGDEVLGWFEGSFAEYARAAADRVVPKPARLTFEQAAAVPMAGETALRAIRDVGEVQAGHRVLVNGAAGGVGSVAVQIAAALGAEVTGGVQHPQRRARPLARRRARRRLHRDRLHRRAAALRRRPRQRRQPAAAPAASGADPHGHAGLQRGRLTGPRVRPDRLDPPRASPPTASSASGSARCRATGRRSTCSPSPSSSRPVSSPRSSTGRSPLADVAAGLHHVEQGHARGKVVVSVL